MLLSNSGIEQAQPVSVIAAMATSGDNLSHSSTNDVFLQNVTYKQVVSVVKQCDEGQSSNHNASLSANYAASVDPMHGNGNNIPYKGKSVHNRPPVTALKRSPCHICNKYGHWMDIHCSDGSLRKAVPAFDTFYQFMAFIHSKSSNNNESENDSRD